MVTMTATKMLSYANRRLQPGDDFEIKSLRDMKVLLASRKATLKREEGAVSAPPPELAEKIVAVTGTNPPPPNVETTDLRPADPPPSVAASGDVGDKDGDLAAVREKYEKKMGRRPYSGWDVAALREKMEQSSS